MCFTVPYKVIKKMGSTALIEDGRTITLGDDINVAEGGYLQIAGEIAVAALSEQEGRSVRELLTKMNE